MNVLSVTTRRRPQDEHAHLLARSCMESGFHGWLVIDKGLASATADGLARALRGMVTAGQALPQRGDTAAQARERVRAFLARKKAADKLHAVKLYQRALNHWCEYQGILPEQGRWHVWDLQEVPDRALNPYTAQEVRRVLAAVKPRFKGMRQEATLYLLAHTGLRKREVFSFRDDAFDADRGAARLLQPRKGGTVRWVNLPDTAWEPQSRLQRYLAARPATMHRALWVTEQGDPLTLGGFTSDLWELRVRSGVPLNFNRWRHSRGLLDTILHVPEEVQAEEWSHSDKRSTSHYMHRDQAARRNILAARGVPGYQARDLGRELVDALGEV